MKVLHLTPNLPWPADSGGRIGIWNQLRADSHIAQVGLLSFAESEPDPAALSALGSVCWEVEVVRRPRSLDGVVGGARSLLSATAMNLAKYRWPIFSRTLVEFVERWQPDIVVAHHLHMGAYLSELADRGVVRVLREHNIDSDLMDRYAASLRNPAMAAFARRQAEQIRDTEAQLCPRVEMNLVITRQDELKLKEIAKGAPMSIVPGAINPAEYPHAALPEKGEDPLLVTAGSLSFRPTGEGVVEFVEQVWPRIRRQLPRARFRVIGGAHETLRRRLARAPGVEVLGRVDSVAPYLDGAGAFVVPLRVGSGMRIRILEAMAWGVPIVSTSIGCEGIEVENGRHILVADTHDGLAAAALKLLKEPVLAQTLRREGHRLVEKKYSLEAVEATTGRIYRRLLSKSEVDAATG